jgi:hypothetical protein
VTASVIASPAAVVKRSVGLVLLILLAGCEREPRPLRAVAARGLDAGVAALVARPSPLDGGTLDAPAIPAADEPAPAPDDAGPRPIDNRPIDDLTLDDLHLIAVVASQQGPTAMVTTPSGQGVSLRRGMYVGRAEPARAGEMARWRVARITPSRLRSEPDGRLVESPADVVFERPAPGTPTGVEERSLALSSPIGPGQGSIRLTAPAAPARPPRP